MADQHLAEQALECPVCLTLPEGEVHQCNEGHCCCADCWNRLEEPRRCPECRQPVPQACRSRVAERAIAALEWSCEHCGEATTRGAKTAHLAACPQRPTACAAAVAGCGWAGMMSEQAAHEAACPFAVCLRMMAPLQAECQELRARVAVLAPLLAQNQQLQVRVRALEGDEEEGGRRQRQRVGPAPHDAPPSDAAVAAMGLMEVLAALRAHVADARVAEKTCAQLAELSQQRGTEQAAAEAGAIEAVLDAMREHPRAAGVLRWGCKALALVCYSPRSVAGSEAACAGSQARKQRAADARALEVVVDAMRAHPLEPGVLRWGCGALANVCEGVDAAALARRQGAAGAGALEAVLEAFRAHRQQAYVQEECCTALATVCGGSDEAAVARKQRVVEAGAIEEVVEAMRVHALDTGVQHYGCWALLCVCGGGVIAAARARKRRATQAGGRAAAAAALQAHPGDAHVQYYGKALLYGFPQ